MEIHALRETYRDRAQRLMAEPFGSPRVFSRGVLYDSERLPGLVAERESGPVGLLQYHVDHDQWQVVVLVGVARRQGVGG